MDACNYMGLQRALVCHVCVGQPGRSMFGECKTGRIIFGDEVPDVDKNTVEDLRPTPHAEEHADGQDEL